MGDERPLLILPMRGERILLLVSTSGATQAFEMTEDVALEAFAKDMEQDAAISLTGGFDDALEELSKIHAAVEMPTEEKFAFLARAFFRFTEGDSNVNEIIQTITSMVDEALAHDKTPPFIVVCAEDCPNLTLIPNREEVGTDLETKHGILHVRLIKDSRLMEGSVFAGPYTFMLMTLQQYAEALTKL